MALTNKEIIAAMCEIDPIVNQHMRGHLLLGQDYVESLEGLVVDLVRQLRSLEDSVSKFILKEK